MSDVLISLDNVSKKFSKNLRRSLLYGTHDILSNIAGRAIDSSVLRRDEFWSVDAVSFDVRRGECVGLIGPNGAGKSTLLKMLNGIYPPDSGSITMRGEVGALIEVGAGFHPMLTGRENIFIAGSIYGFDTAQIKKRFDEIVAFAEIEEFLDMPVKFYSSGMYVRLGFAVAAQMNPDVFLIDEVLAVGDVGFRSKCYNYIARVNQDAAIIFVSHNMSQVSRICDRVLVMDHGRLVHDGGTITGIERYHNLFHADTMVVSGTGEATVSNVRINESTEDIVLIEYGTEFSVSFDISVDKKYSDYIVSLDFLKLDLQLVAQCNSVCNQVRLRNDGSARITVTIPHLLCNAGTYILSLLIYDGNHRMHLYWNQGIKRINVNADVIGSAPVQWNGVWSVEPKKIQL